MRRLRRPLAAAAASLVLFGTAVSGGSAPGGEAPSQATDGAPGAAAARALDAVARGRYLAVAGNCVSCHTREGGESYAGGLEFYTPFGTLYSTNVTPDPETGIGRWTRAQFVAALREGVRPDGAHLYPAFPYTSYTKVTDEDASALYDYFRTLPAVAYRPPANRLRFPYGERRLLAGWKMMYFRPGRFVPDPAQPADWNRGAYLVEGLGHCGACHTPRNVFGAERAGLELSGGVHAHTSGGQTLEWASTNLTPAAGGLAAWSADDVVDYLRHGRSTRAGVFGPMNEVVLNSTRHLAEADVRAMATYLRALRPIERDPGDPPHAETMRAGEVLYSIHCGTCHLPTGLGSETTAPPLAGSAVAQAPDPHSLINVVLHGPELPATSPSPRWQARRWQRMEAFGAKLDDEETALLTTYVRNAWGNRASVVTAGQVADQR